MKRSWFPILSVAVLLGLLALLATLQYKWLGQISDGERERLQNRVQDDTRRFSEDFNREIQTAYFTFQFGADVWKNENYDEFNKRFAYWNKNSNYPALIKNIYFAEAENLEKISEFDKQKGVFQPSNWTEDLNDIKNNLAKNGNFETVYEKIPALIKPIYENERIVNQVFLRVKKIDEESPRANPPVQMPKKFGFLIIALDETVIKNQILPDLTRKYFSDSESANFNVSVSDAENRALFQTGEVVNADASGKLLDPSPDNLMFFSREDSPPVTDPEKRKDIIFSQIETHTEMRNGAVVLPKRDEKAVDVKIIREKDSSPRVRVFEQAEKQNGLWTLNVQHSAGSLEQFITNTRNKNLAISFGILSLLAVSVVLIFLSAQRAKIFAQRQVDFVSSVSHEFRTPLAVIYSAGENLSDGVVRDESKIANYGGLIKREGKKLSAMVEQILEFAGAKSGKRKYDFRPVNVDKIIDEAIAECRPMIDEKQFTVEREIAENLPQIAADEKALTQAIQNLIANALKYSNGSKWLKVSARNGNNELKIAVEDKGIGIEKNELNKIFEPFYRSKKVVDEQIHGNGLGLSLVKQIVAAHRGKIFVESANGKGSKFIIRLPMDS